MGVLFVRTIVCTRVLLRFQVSAKVASSFLPSPVQSVVMVQYHNHHRSLPWMSLLPALLTQAQTLIKISSLFIQSYLARRKYSVYHHHHPSPSSLRLVRVNPGTSAPTFEHDMSIHNLIQAMHLFFRTAFPTHSIDFLRFRHSHFS